VSRKPNNVKTFLLCGWIGKCCGGLCPGPKIGGAKVHPFLEFWAPRLLPLGGSRLHDRLITWTDPRVCGRKKGCAPHFGPRGFTPKVVARVTQVEGSAGQPPKKETGVNVSRPVSLHICVQTEVRCELALLL
jgi:hypothetical protein